MGELTAPELLRRITPQSVEQALKGLPVSLRPTRDAEWLAQKIRGVANAYPFVFNDDLRRPSHADTGENLERLAIKAGELLDALPQRIGPEADAMSQALGSRNYTTTEFRDVLDQLRRVLPSLVDLAKDTADDLRGKEYRQHKRWLATQEKAKRVAFGQFLAPIYEEAFGHEITVNDWGSHGSRAGAPNAFAKYYLGMMKLVFGAEITTNLHEVLKETRVRHRAGPLSLGGDPKSEA